MSDTADEQSGAWSDATSCVACGLCLPHCPTFRVTGQETFSPRGRLAAMEARDAGLLAVDDDFVTAMETCVQCRACEAACPSAVPFGALIEQTRSRLADAGHLPRWQRVGLGAVRRPRLLRVASSILAVAQRARLVPSRRLGLPQLPIRRPAPVRALDADVLLFTGCVMDAWDRATHHAAVGVLHAVGLRVDSTGDRAPCCGALHRHAGLTDEARDIAAATMAGLPGERPIVVDSAGCGAALKEYGQLLGTDEARAFSARVVDVHEIVASRVGLLADALPASGGERARVGVQDPCHLRHVQSVHGAVRTVLDVVADIVELDDDGLCCGAGGAFSVSEPEMAGAIRERKVAAIERAGVTVVASANPGCTYHLAAATALSAGGVEVVHPMVVVDRARRGDDGIHG